MGSTMQQPASFGHEDFKFLVVEVLATGEKCLQDALNAPSRMEGVVWGFQRRIDNFLTSLAHVRALRIVPKTRPHVLRQKVPYLISMRAECVLKHGRLPFQQVNFSRCHLSSIAQGEI